MLNFTRLARWESANAKTSASVGILAPGEATWPGNWGSVRLPQSRLPDLRERQVLDVFAHVRELGVVRRDRSGVQALLAADLAVVGDDLVAVLGDLEVKLEGGDAGLDPLREGRQG